MSADLVSQILEFYPRIFFACHTRHVEDPKTKQVLTANQASVLDHLDGDEPASLYDLALHMGVTPSTMSITVSRLETLGYLLKEKNPKDGRGTLIRLTKAGEKIKSKKSVLDPNLVKNLLKRLSKEEQETAVKGLGLLAFAAELEMKNKSLSRSWSRGK
ncbi:MarR family transcriptional regulator [Leptospira sp. FAT2]|uniref:MarR family winged helix-turn-helix transcriptional regulator n=1 Tax=Leptospira sanjuanensis TaxID=2879643 RepID=UPI001EE86C21|nr:MarR family transcriptional regulator [Leptospira sanjuanensis]MCG6169363.1 MarR family transcriptional regulator [Leptospira sanjuanensis]MCG6194763.1 MarR family transcriptional regulator [Leptospira sanjuanensis]